MKVTKNNFIRKGKLAILFFSLVLLFCPVNVLASPNASSAPSASSEETQNYLPLQKNGDEAAIGRYQYNYTGNWNYFSNFNAITGMEEEACRNTAIAGYLNSSGATLSNTSGADGIVKAYLIWETRAPYEQLNENVNHVSFLTSNQVRFKIYPDYVYNDNRKYAGWGNVDQRRCYVMVADVTSIVQSYGYGTYYVANIPEYHNIDAGGDNVCSWQLVVVEEGDDFPVRALTLKMGAKWRFGDAAYGDSSYLDTNVQFVSGIKSKSSGNVTGQLLFGCANDHDSMYTNLATTLYTADSSGNRTRVAGSVLPGGGLYKNGIKQIGEFGIVTDLTNITGGLGNNATVVGAEVNNIFWNSLLYTGTAIDIAFPDFTSSQKTTVNSATSVTVTGTITNTSSSTNTGIYNGNLVVTLDSALKPTSSIAIIDGNKTIQGVYDASKNTITFSGEAIKNIMRGNTVKYTIQCSTGNSGKTLFENSDSFSGKLRADGIDTNYWINNACTSSSSAIPKYKITINKGEGIEEVTGGGEYTYGTNVKIDAEPEPGYHWKEWTGDYPTPKQDPTFKMPAKDIVVTAEAEANTYTIVFDPNDGTEVIPIDNITVKYDEEISLPDVLLADGTAAYIKYTLDGEIVTDKILSGEIVIDETGRVVRMSDEGLPEGSVVAADGTITTPEGTVIKPDGTVIMPDGTITSPDGTVTSPDGTVTTADGVITKPDGTVIMPNGTIFNADGTLYDANAGAVGTSTNTGTESTESTETTDTEENTTSTDSNTNTESGSESEQGTSSASVVRKEVSRVAEPDGSGDEDIAEGQTEELATEPEPDKTAYASIFLGWAFDEYKFDVTAQWKAQEVMSVNELVEAAGVTEQDGAIITLYAVWDDCPWIQATNLYYTLEQAQSGFITEAEILSHASAADREDGSPIAPGVHDNGTSFTIPDYQASDFTQFQHEGSCTENLTVVDSVGSTYSKQITVYIVDTTPTVVNPDGYTRFINSYYYNQPYENGGLEDNSLWKTEADYVAEIQKAFDNMANNTPMMTFTYSHEDIEAMKEYVETHGVGNSKESGALQIFYDQFMAPNMQ